MSDDAEAALAALEREVAGMQLPLTILSAACGAGGIVVALLAAPVVRWTPSLALGVSAGLLVAAPSVVAFAASGRALREGAHVPDRLPRALRLQRVGWWCVLAQAGLYAAVVWMR